MPNEYDKILDDMMAKCEALCERCGEVSAAANETEPLAPPPSSPGEALWTGVCLVGHVNLLLWRAWSSALLPPKR